MRLRSTVAILSSAALAAGFLIATPAAAAEAPRPFVSGWFGWWASDTAVNEMAASSDGVVGEVAMFWWSFQGSENPLCIYDNGDYDKQGDWGDCMDPGWSTPWTTPKFDRQRQALQAAGIKINASITDLSQGTANELADFLRGVGKDGKANAERARQNRSAYAKQITEYALKAKVDGIDLDWENFAFNDGKDTWPQTRKAWIAFIKVLSKNLHAADLTLWATVPGGSSPFVASWMSPTDECGNARGSVGSPNPGTGYCVYAWSEIAPYVDRLKIMAYDYSFSVPGPIGPNNWARLVAESAVAQVGAGNAGKVWIGAPQYGRNWPLTSGTGWVVDSECPEGWKPDTPPARTTMSPSSARELAARTNADVAWDKTFGEWTFEYWLPTAGKVKKKAKQCDVKRRVWFADTRSALARAQIVPDLRIGGIAVWDFGTVQTDFYPRLADYGREIAPAATSVTVTAPKATDHGRLVSVRVATDSRAGGAKGAQATLYFQRQGGAAGPSKVETRTLDAEGKGTFSVPAEASGTWTVEVDGSWSRSPGEGQAQTIVRYAVTARASATRVDVGTPVTITGTVSPGSAGLQVSVQRRGSNGSWRDVSATTAGAQGTVTATVKPTVAGEFAYRLLVPESASLARGTSARIMITAR